MLAHEKCSLKSPFLAPRGCKVNLQTLIQYSQSEYPQEFLKCVHTGQYTNGAICRYFLTIVVGRRVLYIGSTLLVRKYIIGEGEHTNLNILLIFIGDKCC